MNEENKYRALKKQIFSKGNLFLVPIRYKDRFKIMKWRNDQINRLRQKKKITKTDQTSYFEEVITKLFKQAYPEQLLFSFLEDDICLGYGGLVNIDWPNERAEMSFLLETSLTLKKEVYDNYLSSFISLIKELFFKELKLNKLFTETYEFRKDHIKVLEKNGFIFEAVLKEHTFNESTQKFQDSVFHYMIHHKNEPQK